MLEEDSRTLYARYMHCFATKLAPSMLALRAGTGGRARSASSWLHIRFVHEGWFRSFEGNSADFNRSLYGRATQFCKPSGETVFLHGWKRIGQELAPSIATETCAAPPKLLKTARQGCRMMTEWQSRQLAVDLCAWLHPIHGRAALSACREPKHDTENEVALRYVFDMGWWLSPTPKSFILVPRKVFRVVFKRPNLDILV
jgi:hypothetical protein